MLFKSCCSCLYYCSLLFFNINFRFSKVHLSTIDIATKMMELDHYTTATSTECADCPTSIKEEPNDDGPQSEVQLSYQQHLADNTSCEIEDYKYDRPIINIAPIVTGDDCVSTTDEDQLTVKSEPDVIHNAAETSIQTAVKSEVVTNMIPNLYEVKNESPCSTNTKIFHNNIDSDSGLVEVPGELDCKPEIIDNVNNIGVLGDVNMQTSVQYNDTVDQKPLPTSMNNCEVDSKETTALGK